MKRVVKKWWWVFLIIPIVLNGTFVIWALTPLGPMPEALTALESDGEVNVITKPWLIFQSKSNSNSIGYIIYPGGRVDYRSYAPAAREIAKEGYLVVIAPMTLNLAVLSLNEAQKVMDAYPEIQSWVIGGHSLGGSMAAKFANKEPEIVQGLILWASYPASSDDLSDSNISVISIYGTNDGLATVEEINNSRPLLPENTIWISIEGGNHAQFGWYGDQSGDYPASISREDQQTQIIDASLNFLEKLLGTK